MNDPSPDSTAVLITSPEQLLSLSSNQPQYSQDMQLVLFQPFQDKEILKQNRNIGARHQGSRSSHAHKMSLVNINDLSKAWRQACSQGPPADVLCSFRSVKFDFGLDELFSALVLDPAESTTDPKAGPTPENGRTDAPTSDFDVCWETVAPTVPPDRESYLVKEMDFVRLAILLANIMRMRVQSTQTLEPRRLVFQVDPGTLPLGPRNDLQRALDALSIHDT